jgi:hypothetical protein
MDYVDLLNKDADGRFRLLGSSGESYEVEKDTPVLILKMAKVLHDRCGFNTKKPISGLDESVIECTKGDMQLLLAWDSESGLCVKGRGKESAGRPRELSACLEGLFDHEVFEGYIRLVR